MNRPSAPLQGTTVVEIGQNVAAPTATLILADLGARVIKIEKPGGDDARSWAPPYWHGTSAIFQCMNRNKESVVADFSCAEDVNAVRALIAAQADVVIQSMRPGRLLGLGVDAQELRKLKPGLIWCDLGAFGSGGPLESHPGYDPLMQAFAGLMSVTGEAGAPPVRTGFSVVDVGAGMWAAIGILSALHRRSQTGQGCMLEVSLFEAAMHWMASAAAHFQSCQQEPERQGSGTPTIVPYRAYQTQDRYLVVAAASDSLFAKLAAVLGQPDWLTDQRFADNPARVRHRAVLDAKIEEILLRRPSGEWTRRLDAAGIPCAPVQGVREALEHPHTRAIGINQPVPGMAMSLIGLPARFDGERPRIRTAAPALNAHASALADYRSGTRAETTDDEPARNA